MKTTKIILTVAVIAAGITALASCSNIRNAAVSSANEAEQGEVTGVQGLNDNISDRPTHSGLVMSVNPGEYDSVPQSVNVTLTNNTASVAQYGAEFTVKRYNEGAWEIVPETRNFPVIMILYALPSGESRDYTFNLRPDVVDYTPGNYRLIKRITLDNVHVYQTEADFEIY